MVGCMECVVHDVSGRDASGNGVWTFIGWQRTFQTKPDQALRGRLKRNADACLLFDAGFVFLNLGVHCCVNTENSFGGPHSMPRNVELGTGIEPVTCGLQGRCSTN